MTEPEIAQDIHAAEKQVDEGLGISHEAALAQALEKVERDGQCSSLDEITSPPK
ncbi:MAG TPA: hypothetical protein VNO70_02810 [Blastocatellia bacterium]|nr:hypothetical protein [Blastocatellia bacterium]